MTPRTLLLAAALALSPALPAFAQAPPPAADKGNAPKLNDIRRLMAITGAAQLGQQILDQLIPTFKQTMPNVPEKFWQDFSKEARPQDLVEQVVDIYDKYLTHDEVKAVIKFYETPAGKKLISVLPQVTQESMVAGQNWGRDLGERIARRLEAQKKD